MPNVRLGRKYYFSALHTIPQEDFVHGHNYELDVLVSGNIDESGLVFSRETLDQLVKDHFISHFDRRWVNDHVLPATGENLAQYAFDKIADSLPKEVRLVELQLHETRKNSFTAISQ